MAEAPGGFTSQKQTRSRRGRLGSEIRRGSSSRALRMLRRASDPCRVGKPAAFAPRSARSPSSCERTAFVHREAGGGRRSPPTAATPMRSRPICSTATSKPLRPMRSGSLTSPTSQLTKAGSTSPPSRIWPRWRSSAGRWPERLKSVLCEDALEDGDHAVSRRLPMGLIHHSDRKCAICLR